LFTPSQSAELLEEARRSVRYLGSMRELLRSRGWSFDDIVGRVVRACMDKQRKQVEGRGRGGFNPDRGRIGQWVGTVARSTMKNLCDNRAQPYTGAGGDVAVAEAALHRLDDDFWHRPVDDEGSERSRRRRQTPKAQAPAQPAARKQRRAPAVVRRRRKDG
jgi:hypothetical protein